MGLRIRPVDRDNDARIRWFFGWKVYWYSKKGQRSSNGMSEKREWKTALCVMIFIFLFSIATLWIPHLDTLPQWKVGDHVSRSLVAAIDFEAEDTKKIDEDKDLFVKEYPLVLIKTQASQTAILDKFAFFLKELERRFECERDGRQYEVPSDLDDEDLVELSRHVLNLPKELGNYFSGVGTAAHEDGEESYRMRVFKSRLNAYYVLADKDNFLKRHPSFRRFKVIGEDGAEYDPLPIENLLSPKDAAESLLDNTDFPFSSDARSFFVEVVALFFDDGNLTFNQQEHSDKRSDDWVIVKKTLVGKYIRKFRKGDEIFENKRVLDEDDLRVYEEYRDALNKHNNPFTEWWSTYAKKSEVAEETDEPDVPALIDPAAAENADAAQSTAANEQSSQGEQSAAEKQPPTFFGALRSLISQIYPKVFQIFMILVFCCIYLRHAHPELCRNSNSLWLVGFIICVTLCCMIGSVKMWYFIPYANKIDDYLLLPLALPALILTPIFGGRIALFSGLYVTAISAVALENNQFETILLGLLVSGCAALAVRKIYDAGNFVMHGFISGFFPTLLAVFFFDNGDLLEEIIRFVEHSDNGGNYEFQASDFLSVTVVNLFTPVIAFVILTILDKCSRHVATNLSYLALIDPASNKLLVRLRKDAPGTYHHSLGVASLAAAAAEKIQANSLKAQAYACYHDIGKLTDPSKFTENDPKHEAHQGLSPVESASCIRRHVEDGQDYGKQYRLKTHILRAIEQHHGDDVISFFYKKQKEATGQEPDHDVFFYKGPKPYEKEIAILMLADCCEAASHSLQNPTPEDIRKCVSDIFLDKFRNNQLDESKLSLRELAAIREVFVNELVFMRHSRVSYKMSDTDPTQKIQENPSPESTDSK